MNRDNYDPNEWDRIAEHRARKAEYQAKHRKPGCVISLAPVLALSLLLRRWRR